MTQSSTLSVGMDVPNDALAVASIAPAPHAAVVALDTIGTRQCAIDTLLRRLQAQSTSLVCVDEAGPCGFGL